MAVDLAVLIYGAAAHIKHEQIPRAALHGMKIKSNSSACKIVHRELISERNNLLIEINSKLAAMKN